ncbi:hypothetical protein BC834DRAFT_857798 [Gloeopeniophorella convolvens]|nr:hypothetical protein BC834DRAFT_857798 [Gloeopeniophorella convolvens]
MLAQSVAMQQDPTVYTYVQLRQGLSNNFSRRRAIAGGSRQRSCSAASMDAASEKCAPHSRLLFSHCRRTSDISHVFGPPEPVVRPRCQPHGTRVVE